MRIQQGDEIGIFYHENGFLKSKSYELRNGLSASINYSEEIENQIIGGRKGNWSKLIFKNKQLAEIRSLYKVAQLDVLDVNTSIERPKDLQNRSEEHTSELQSRPHLVCRLLLEKKKPPYLRC